MTVLAIRLLTYLFRRLKAELFRRAYGTLGLRLSAYVTVVCNSLRERKYPYLLNYNIINDI